MRKFLPVSWRHPRRASPPGCRGSDAAAGKASATESPGAAAKDSLGRAHGDPGNLDPQLTRGLAQEVAEFAYDTLVTAVGPGKIVSGLATVVEGRLAEEGSIHALQGSRAPTERR